MKIDSFEYRPRKQFTLDLYLNTSGKCLGVLLYKVHDANYWIELHLDGFVVNDGYSDFKFHTLQDAYKAMCVFIVENK